MKPQPRYDVSRDTWYPHQCPFGDDCSKCDVDGHCEKGRAHAAAAVEITTDTEVFTLPGGIPLPEGFEGIELIPRSEIPEVRLG